MFLETSEGKCCQAAGERTQGSRVLAARWPVHQHRQHAGSAQHNQKLPEACFTEKQNTAGGITVTMQICSISFTLLQPPSEKLAATKLLQGRLLPLFWNLSSNIARHNYLCL